MVLCIAVILLSLHFVMPLFRMVLPEFWAKLADVVFMVVCVSPFLRAIVMKKNRNEALLALQALGSALGESRVLGEQVKHTKKMATT